MVRQLIRATLHAALASLCLQALAGPPAASTLAPPERALPLAAIRSGLDYAGDDVKALQADPQANPGLLWLAEGQALWQQRDGAAPSCAGCHGASASMANAARRHPRISTDTPDGQPRLLNLEDRIRHCRQVRQGLPAWAPQPQDEPREVLALALLLAHAARGQPYQVGPQAPAQADDATTLHGHWQAGQALWQRRQGQMNLACMHCHDQRAGLRFYADPLSQGQPNGYPLYRLEWQAVGSLERRLRSCYQSLRADAPPPGSLPWRQLALYLAWRAGPLPIEAPAVRK